LFGSPGRDVDQSRKGKREAEGAKGEHWAPQTLVFGNMRSRMVEALYC
jgi:hypothetical protein